MKYTYTILSQANPRWPGRPANSTTAKQAPEPIPPPLKIQIFELLRQNGFAFNEALELAGEAINRFNALPRQRVFAFGPVSFEITAAL